MKKLFLASATMTLFAISFTLFQFSCKKNVIAQTINGNNLPIASTSTLGSVIAGSGLVISNSGVLSTESPKDVILYFKEGPTGHPYEYWVCSKDGSNQKKVNFPSNVTVSNEGVSLLNDKKSVVFSGSLTWPAGLSELYTMKIDGSELRKIVGNGTDNFYSPKTYW